VSDTFDAYARTMITITLPDGTDVETAPGQPVPPVLAGLVPLHVITAWNPRSEISSDEANNQAHRRLEARLGALPKVVVLEAIGRDSRSSHYELSVAVQGLTGEQAVELARDFGQNAIFVIDVNGVEVLDTRATGR
jgi:hypothetical protein